MIWSFATYIFFLDPMNTTQMLPNEVVIVLCLRIAAKKNTHTYRFSIDQLEICKWFIIGFEISSCVHVRTNQSRSDYLASYDDLISGEKLAFVRLNEWEYN